MQERDLGWIAGIVDGEGTITICRISGYMRPIVQVVNTNMSLLLEVQQIFAEIIGKKTRICMITRYKKHTLDCYRIQVTKQFEVETILKTIKPYLIAKVEQARLVLDFLEIRKSVVRKPRSGKKGKWCIGGQDKPYSNREEGILSQVKLLNNYRTRRDLTLRSSNKEGMRKSELHGDMQSKAEMSLPLN